MFPRVHHSLVTISAAPMRLVALAAIAALVALDSMPAGAGPNGATVVGGSASVQGAGTGSVTVNQTTQNTVINWSTFNIGAGETTTFNQPNSSAIALNRVIGGGGASFIDGTLTANGRVFIVNGDGVLIGRGAVINTAGFLATTNDVSSISDFMAGTYNFNVPGNPSASIVNLGRITASNGGFAALVAPGVRNSGTISARLGTVTLAASNSFTLDFYGDQLITLAVNDQIASSVIDVATGKPLKSLVSNTGTLRANGGLVQLTAAAAEQVVHSVINNKGVIEANSIGSHNGMIVLSAATGTSKPAGAPVQTVKVSGKISAAGKKAGTTGGTVVVTGENIVLAGANIDASGQAGGGHVLIGGDTGGGNPSALAASIAGSGLESFAVPTATTVSVDAASVINASATGSGNGGKVVIWSDQQTTFAGTIFAQGGASGGNGGFVETSGHQTLAYTGTVDTRAPNGSWGTLLLDPGDVTIQTTGPDTVTGGGGAFSGSSAQVDSILTVATLESALASSSVIVQTDTSNNTCSTFCGNIFVANSISWSTGATLTLSAWNSINIASGVTITNTGAGSLILRADSIGRGSGVVSFVDNNSVNFSNSTGTVSIYYDPIAGYTIPTYPQDYANLVQTNPGVTNQSTAYMLVNNVTDLGNISQNLNGTYALGANIDASSFAGFTSGTTFNGLLDGNGGLGANYAISNLTLSLRHGSDSYGLFPFIGSGGTVSNIILTNVNITAGADIQFIGALAGQNSGTISNVTVASGNVSGGLFMGIGAGGVVGQNQGTITNAISAVTVSVGNATSDSELNFAGGVVASNLGAISNAIATGNVGGGAFSWVGGLVGQNGLSGSIGTINSSYALGNVNVSGFSSMAGGLVGFQQRGSSIFNSQAFGDVTATANAQQSSDGSFAGGLVGQNFGTINGTNSPTLASRCIPGATMSCAAGAVSVGTNGSAGGLVGGNQGFIGNALANGAVSGSSNDLLGGLAGESDHGGSIVASVATGNVHGSGANDVAGGLVGFNLGSIDPSLSSGSVSCGPNCIVGGFVGANEGGFPPVGNGQFGTICPECVGTGSFSAGPGSFAGPQVGFGAGSAGGSDANLPSQALLIQDMFRDFTLVSLTPPDVVDTTGLNGPPAQAPRPGRGPGGLPPEFGSRFFVVPPPGETRFVKDEVVLQIPTNIPFDQLQAIMRRLGLSVLGTTSLDLLGVTTYRLHIDNGATLASVIRALASYQIIAGAQANYIYGLAQNDPQQLAQDLAQDPDLAGRTQEGDAAQYALSKLGLIDIHRVVKGANISIAVIDSQIDVNHPDLDGVIVEQFDAVGQAEAPHPHGTGMAGAIAAHRRLMGIAPSAKIYAIHAFSSNAASAESTTFNILKGLDWAANKGVRVINMSFAGPRDPSMERALHAAHDKGIVLVAAAGNAGPKSPPLYPGADPDVIAVTATDINDKLFAGANRGHYIAVAAPGVDILVPAPDSTYQLTTGTSVASAEVSGIAALLLERNPNLTPDEIRRILTASARHPGSKERDDDFGWGLVDPSKAIQDVNDLKPVARH
jgi:filamentous hemagglutinin family protein